MKKARTFTPEFKWEVVEEREDASGSWRYTGQGGSVGNPSGSLNKPTSWRMRTLLRGLPDCCYLSKYLTFENFGKLLFSSDLRPLVVLKPYLRSSQDLTSLMEFSELPDLGTLGSLR